MFAVLITGPPGAGKTSVLTAHIAGALTDGGVLHVADWGPPRGAAGCSSSA